MNLQPYAGHKAPSRLTYPKNPTEVERLNYRLRVRVCDDGGLMVDAAEMLTAIAKQLAAADARVTELEAELIATRALNKVQS